jgi:uncharacterized iron-regulated membrane protein
MRIISYFTFIFTVFAFVLSSFSAPSYADMRADIEAYAEYLLCAEEKGEGACTYEDAASRPVMIDGQKLPDDARRGQDPLQQALVQAGLYLKQDGQVAALSNGAEVKAVRIERGRIVIDRSLQVPDNITLEAIVIDPTKQNLGLE